MLKRKNWNLQPVERNAYSKFVGFGASVFFENTEISQLAELPGKTLEEIYIQTIARKHVTMKLGLVQLLRQHGIQSIYTQPADLSLNTINKYLELKSRGLI